MRDFELLRHGLEVPDRGHRGTVAFLDLGTHGALPIGNLESGEIEPSPADFHAARALITELERVRVSDTELPLT